MTVADLSAVPNPPGADVSQWAGGEPARDVPRRFRRARAWWQRTRARVLGPARLLPGLAAFGCAFAGSWLLWSLGVALLVGAGLLIVVDARIPASNA